MIDLNQVAVAERCDQWPLVMEYLIFLLSDKNPDCYGNLKFPLTYYGTNCNAQPLLFNWLYLDFHFTEIFIKKFFTFHKNALGWLRG